MREEVLERYFKSEGLPVRKPNYMVRSIVGKNWRQIVMDPTKDVLVAYVAEYCAACKELTPILDELAKKTPDDLIIATFNGDYNEAEGLTRP